MDVTIVHGTAPFYGEHAALLATRIEDEFDVTVQRRTCRAGRFEVLLDGDVIARRDEGGWPDVAAVIDAIAQRERAQA